MSLFGVFGPRRRRRRAPLTSRRDLTTVVPSSPIPVVPPLQSPVGLDQAGKVATADGSGGTVWVEPMNSATIVNPVASTTSTTISPVGTISMWLGTEAPSGWLLLNGSTFDKNVYPKLFAVWGSNVLPDMRGRFPLGKADSGTGSTIGQTGGALDHTHSAVKHTHGIGSHTHSVPGATVTTGTASGSEVDKLSLLGILGTKASGTGHSHSVTIPAGTSGTATGTTDQNADGTTGANNPPYFVVSFIVKAV